MAELKPKITLTWKQCEMIARYYRFPTYIFLLTERNMESRLKGKRKDTLLDKIADIRKINNDAAEGCAGYDECPHCQIKKVLDSEG